MVPSSIGPYRIIEGLGSGANGEVYLAEDTRLGRKVAVKTLSALGSTDLADARRWVLREARAAARLNHPNIASVYDVLESPEGAHIVMEYVRGDTLKVRLLHGPLPAGHVLEIAIQLADALAEAHSLGVVHRDLKPGNVVITPKGTVKVLDFGLAQVRPVDPGSTPVRSSKDFTLEGRQIGTPPYMPPEHLMGDPVDVRGDIYSLGVMLFELLTGQRPFQGPDAMALTMAVLTHPTPRASASNPDVPAALDAAVYRAMSRMPVDRYASVMEMATDLKAAAAGPGVLQQPVEHADYAEADTLERPGERRRHRTRLLAGAAVVLFIAVLVARPWKYVQNWLPRQAAAASTESLAVVPFENATGDPAWTHLADGVTDDLARELQRAGVLVKSRESASHLRGLTDPELAENVRRLNVDRLATGRISLEGADILFEAKLAQVSTGAVLWRRSYRQPLDRLGGLYATVAADIALTTRRAPTREALSAHRANFKAYEAYHKGRVYWEQRTKKSLSKSIQYFKEATQLDLAYAQPWAGMADAYLALGVPTFGALRPQEARRLANEAALKALDLDPNLAEAHASLAFASFFYDWNWTAAEERFRKTIQLNPQYATAHHWYANYLNAMGRQDEAMREIQTAFQLEPLSILIHRDFAWHYFFQRNYAAASAQLEETLKIDPRYTAARSLLGRALIEQGRYVDGLAELREAAKDMPPSAAFAFIAYAEAAAGQTANAERTLKEMLKLSDKEYVSPYYVALIYTRLGRPAQALDWLERGFKEQDTTMVSLNIDPRFDALRRESRFDSLIRRMNFPSKGGKKDHIARRL